ncbi:MAG: serine hydrolase [Clostridia bacterium]|nr:serine hydrolase [Clostridia bacterium]
MNYATPESQGIRSENILEYIQILEDARLATHDIILARGNDILYENYWAPFHRDFCHRQYSVTKSIVSIAIGFLEQDGMIDLDDKIAKYFPEEIKNQPDENMHNQTIRHMLMMSTAKPAGNWFADKPEDRVRHYFENDNKVTRPSGTIYEYDSEGSFIMGALVERLTGKTLKEYLTEKLFSKIGVSEENYFLKCPGGHTWGDSAAVFRPIDMLKIARFTMNYGSWNGEQILNEAYLRAATARQIDNDHMNGNGHDCQGYGYQIWRTYDNSFCFYGMGCQFAICVPDKDIILIYNGDNQGKDYAKKYIFDDFFRLIVRTVEDGAIPENEAAQRELAEYSKTRKLLTAIGETDSEWKEKVNGVTYVLDESPSGIREFTLTFEGNKGVFRYINAQGEKEIPFGMCENVFGEFPQDGYSNEMGTKTGTRRYRSAFSAAWVTPNKLCLKVQAIDEYFGNLYINFGFRDNLVGIHMDKSAEDFFDEYVGYAQGKQK